MILNPPSELLRLSRHYIGVTTSLPRPSYWTFAIFDGSGRRAVAIYTLIKTL